MTGRGIERVALRRCWVEEGTGGLWYASVDASVELRRDSSRGRTGGSASTAAAAAAAAAAATSSGSRAASRAAYTSDDGPAPSERAATIRRLERAISQGAPAYNRGDVRTSTYARPARCSWRRAPPAPSSRLSRRRCLAPRRYWQKRAARRRRLQRLAEGQTLRPGSSATPLTAYSPATPMGSAFIEGTAPGEVRQAAFSPECHRLVQAHVA